MQKEREFKYSRKWKDKNEVYLFELQKFFDIAENIKNEKLRESVIHQMLKCDDVLTKLAEDIIKK